MKTQKLKNLSPCPDALLWASKQKNEKQAWKTCERGDWMLWLVGRLSGKLGSMKRKRLVLTACECARLSLKHIPDGELRPLKAIEIAERWAKGERRVTLQDVRSAADDAYAVANVVYANAVANAAYAAANAANVVYANAVANAAAANAAYAARAVANAYATNAANAAYAAYAAYAVNTDAQNEILKQCADIVRKYYPNPPRL